MITKDKKDKITKLIDESLAGGWRMYKKLHSGGLFTDSTWDNRTVYNRDDLYKLTKEGFFLDNDAGLIALNILLEL